MSTRFTSPDSYRPRILLAAAAGLLAATIANAAGQTPQTTGTQSTDQAEQELARTGEALVKTTCNTSCHGLEKLDEMRRTVRDWNDQVQTMAGNGALATDAQFATIKKYLARYYGVVSVNTATAEELSAVLGLSAKDAQAVVAYRTANGKFADAATLLKVPGIDRKKIEDQPDALVFK
jgi:competence protein ComEA